MMPHPAVQTVLRQIKSVEAYLRLGKMQPRQIFRRDSIRSEMLRTDKTFHRLVRLAGVLVNAGLVVIGLELVRSVEAVAIIAHGDVDERVVRPVDVALVKGD